MRQTNHNTAEHPVRIPSLIRYMLVGAGIAFVLISIFLLPVKAHPDWPEFWKIRPMIVVPLAGAGGGAFTYFMSIWGRKGTWQQLIAVLVSVICYVIALWLGTVVGLDGTLWN